MSEFLRYETEKELIVKILLFKKKWKKEKYNFTKRYKLIG